MSSARNAYQAALNSIARVAASGGRELTLSGDDFRALDRIPPKLAALTGLHTLSLNGTQVNDLAPLAALTGLQNLWLDGTQVSDLAPLAALTGLQTLWLDGTQVSDLRPISGMKEVGDDEGIKEYIGLYYHNTPATKRDGRLADLAQIADPKERTKETLAYLRSLPPWPEPYTPTAAPGSSDPNPDTDIPEPPEQDPALPLIWGERGFAFFANRIASDPVTEDALEDLRRLLEVLHRKGNQHDDLSRIAGELQERSAGDVADLNMVKLHLSYQKLRRLHAGRGTRETPFDDETVHTMEMVFDVLPGVTLADDGVRVLIERQEAERISGMSKPQAEAAERVLLDIQDNDAPFASEVKDVAAAILQPGADDRLAATRGILSRNVVVSVLRFIGRAAAGGVIGSFVYDYSDDLIAFAATMGDDALIWAKSVLSKFRVEYELLMGITKEISDVLPRKRRPPR